MNTADLKDLCLVKLHACRSQLDAAFAGTSGHVRSDDIAALRADLAFWEGVTANATAGTLTSEQLARVETERQKRS